MMLLGGAYLNDNHYHCVLLYRLHHSGGLVVKIQHTWPFPSEDNPLKPWTPEDHKKWAEDKLKDVPESPLIDR